MIYDLTKPLEIKEFRAKCQYLILNDKKVELKEKRNTRSLSQNAYLHVCISLFAIEYGYNLEEAKTLLKRNCSFMIYEKNGDKFLKKTSSMDSKELTDFIEWLRNFAGQHGLYIPTSQEYIENKFEIDKSINSNEHYL